MPKLPKLKEAIKFADWLELTALEADDGNASAEDLISALQIEYGHEISEDTSLEVMQEIEQRQDAAGESYPFILQNGRVLQVKHNYKDNIAYIFCLCLSYYGWKAQKNATINPWKLFEDLCCIAAKQYIQGNVFKFGSRDQTEVSNFSSAVDELCRKIGEGNGFKRQPSLNHKDDKVDLIAWKEFNDKMHGKLIMFGQCAAGENWLDKVDELRPDVFWDQWISDAKTSPHIRSFYIPHRIPREKWQYYVRRAGILFDRCRISYWSYSSNDSILEEQRYSQWCRNFLLKLAD